VTVSAASGISEAGLKKSSAKPGTGPGAICGGYAMNELQFKHHLKDLVHGHHHPEEHDWDGALKKAAVKKPKAAPKRAKKTKG
jgi:hypothetical protein